MTFKFNYHSSELYPFIGDVFASCDMAASDLGIV
jgi:hypothetical protein